MFLEQLCELAGTSGFEHSVRNYIKDKLDAAGCPWKVDKLGNLIVENPGIGKKKIMLMANMDEIGLMITGFDGSGYLRFNPVGEIDARVLNSCDLIIGKNSVRGVIGTAPIHGMKKEDRGKPLDISTLCIDIGARSKEEAMSRVTIGDYAVFASEYTKLGDTIRSKAIDVRFGCSMLLELLCSKPKFAFTAVFSVMKNTDNRGAGCAAYVIKPDVAIMLTSTEVADFPNITVDISGAELRKGPCLYMKNSSAVFDIDMIRDVECAAKTKNIPVQIYKNYKSPRGDVWPVICNSQGVKVIIVGLPCRYIASPVTTISRTDYDNTTRLISMLLEYIYEEE